MAKPKTLKEAMRQMTSAHSNLNTYGAIIGLLEAGTIYDGRDTAKDRIIKIALAEQQKELALHDEARTLIERGI